MDVINYLKARSKLAGLMARVCENHEPIIITRDGHKSVVLISLEDFESLEETAHLLSTASNARRLFDALDSVREQP
jgi:antitoxin YefM